MSAKCQKQSSRVGKIGVLQEQISELLVRAHQLPDVVLDFETGMNGGPIMRRSDKCEKREEILKAFTAQCLPQRLMGALGLRRLDKEQSGRCKYPVFGFAFRDGPVDRRPDCRQTLIYRIELAPPWRGCLEKPERLLDGLRCGLCIA